MASCGQTLPSTSLARSQRRLRFLKGKGDLQVSLITLIHSTRFCVNGSMIRVSASFAILASTVMCSGVTSAQSIPVASSSGRNPATEAKHGINQKARVVPLHPSHEL